MDCSETKKYFWDFIEKKLGDKSGYFTDHLSTCVNCRKEFALFSDIIEQIESEKITSPNPFFVEKTMNKILVPEKETVSIEEWFYSWLGYFKPAFAAVVIILSVATGIYLGLPGDMNQTSNPLDAFAETYGLTIETGDDLFD